MEERNVMTCWFRIRVSKFFKLTVKPIPFDVFLGEITVATTGLYISTSCTLSQVKPKSRGTQVIAYTSVIDLMITPSGLSK